jgi:fused signal recognition particle receptor
MLSFFRRKKPQDAPATEAPKTQHYSAEELAAAFPSAAPVEDKEPAPVAVPAEPAPVEPPRQPPFRSLSSPPRRFRPQPQRFRQLARRRRSTSPHRDPGHRTGTRTAAEPTPAPVTDDLPAAASVDAARPCRQARLARTPAQQRHRAQLRWPVLAQPKLDDDLLDELETALITADVGVGATTDLVEGCASA